MHISICMHHEPITSSIGSGTTVGKRAPKNKIFYPYPGTTAVIDNGIFIPPSLFLLCCPWDPEDERRQRRCSRRREIIMICSSSYGEIQLVSRIYYGTANQWCIQLIINFFWLNMLFMSKILYLNICTTLNLLEKFT
jgi:hypothetical protein